MKSKVGLKIKSNKQLIISIIIFSGLVIATILVVLYGKGYRFGFGSGKIEFNGTGLLVTKSIPDGAQVFINDKLETATDNTINLAPGDYKIRIFKEGYFSWEKDVKIQTEVVSRAEALLIPSAPKLESISDLGAKDPIIDPTLTKIAFKVASQSSLRNGIYVFDMSKNPLLTLQSSSVQIIDDSADLFSEAEIAWSPDGKDLMATTSANGISNTYLLDTDRTNNPPNDITSTITEVQNSWAKMKLAKDTANLQSLPQKARNIVKSNFNILSYSPDKNKIIYEASKSTNLPIVITPRIVGSNPTPEQRNIEQGSIYTYDVKEDRNYKMDSGKFKGAFSWFSNSRHIIFVQNNAVHIMEYDGLNDTTVFAGPFDKDYIFPWQDGTRVVILTNLGNSLIESNLYTISLK